VRQQNAVTRLNEINMNAWFLSKVEYNASGNVYESTGTHKGRFGYGGAFGYQEEDSGLKLLGHRFYDPNAGRFLTRDRIKDGRNWYAYCDNNPVKNLDPSGLATVTIRVSQKGVGHCWIIIRWDNGDTWVLQITLTDNVEVLTQGDDGWLEMLARDYDSERTVHFDEDPDSRRVINEDARNWLDLYNFGGNNCVDFATFIWKLLTGEDLRGSMLGIGTPGKTQDKVEEANAAGAKGKPGWAQNLGNPLKLDWWGRLSPGGQRKFLDVLARHGYRF